ncbi:phenylacetic acid degradation operon negative regulatory protein PaaX [Minwuia sp.]|uniref:phenylacetic acid degradation operon negative regulatory protein PaaX n=1 Tax=Minwuia sp. TaxID=2493630 RepID=UPI003A8D65AD
MTLLPKSDSVGTLLQNVDFRAPSLIVTIWGDTIAPTGAAIWLGSLIRLAQHFGLNERVVRTAVFRLQKDGWLQSTQSGRRSYYELAPAGQHLTVAADARIYRSAAPDWDGTWLTLIAGPETHAIRDRLSRELFLLGFGSPAAGVYVRPDGASDSVREILSDLGVSEHVAAFRSDGALTMAPLHGLVARAWDHGAIDQAYHSFIGLFEPLRDGANQLCDGDAFIVRTLLIHEFRRITLRDPMLPQTLLPPGQSGTAARALARDIYRAVHVQATAHARNLLETRNGRLPKPGAAYYHRFGGLAG